MPAASCLRGSVGDVGECRQLICYERELAAACVRVAKLQAVEARHAHDKPPSQRSFWRDLVIFFFENIFFKFVALGG